MTIAKHIISAFLLALFLLLSGCTPTETISCYAADEAPFENREQNLSGKPGTHTAGTHAVP